MRRTLIMTVAALLTLAVGSALWAPRVASAGTSGVSTQYAHTGAPTVPISLAGQAAGAGGTCSAGAPSACNFLQADATFSITAPVCTAGQFLTSVTGTGLVCQAAPGSAAAGSCSAGQYETADTVSGPTCAQVTFGQLSGTATLSQLASAATDKVLLGDATPVWTAAAVPSCSAGTSALTYNTTTHAFGCNSIAGGAAADGMFYGSGADGPLTCNGAVNLGKPTFYTNLTITAGCSIRTSGYPIFVSGTLDLTAAPANAIVDVSFSKVGAAGSGASAGGAGSALGASAQWFGAGAIGSNGTAGVTTTTCTTPSTGGAITAGAGGNGGGGGLGTGCSFANGGPGGTFTIAGASVRVDSFWTLPPVIVQANNFAAIGGGNGGGGGQGGSGAVANSGGGGGGGGGAGAAIGIWAHVINRGGSTAGCAIAAVGGAGGAGGNGTGTGVGGGGGGGGGGGWIYVAYGTLTGSSPPTTPLCADSGGGGNGGTGGSSSGGNSGFGGSITLVSSGAGTVSVLNNTGTSNNASFNVGGTVVQTRSAL